MEVVKEQEEWKMRSKNFNLYKMSKNQTQYSIVLIDNSTLLFALKFAKRKDI